MLADFFTKPLQGASFTKFRDVILGYKHVDSLDLVSLTKPEERVGSNRADSCGTDGPDADGFTLVTGKKTRKTGTVSWSDVAPLPARMSGCNTAISNKGVSRDHSLETIQSMN